MRAFIYSVTDNKTRCEISDERLPEDGEEITYPDFATLGPGCPAMVRHGRVVSVQLDYARGECWLSVDESVLEEQPIEEESPHCDCEQPGNTYGNDKGVICCMRCGRVAGEK